MTTEISIQEKLNNEMKKREKEEFYEDKLLQLKMITFLDNYRRENQLEKYKNKLFELNKEKDCLVAKKEKILDKIKEIKEEANNYQNKIEDYNNKINHEEETKKEIENKINNKKEYIDNISKPDNFVNHIINNFSEDFKKEIYDICSKAVNDALVNKPEANGLNTNDEKNININKFKDTQTYTPMNGQRSPYFNFPTNIPIQPMGGMRVMFSPYPYNNNFHSGPCMMYPMYMPTQNMPGFSPINYIPPINSSQQIEINDKKNKTK